MAGNRRHTQLPTFGSPPDGTCLFYPASGDDIVEPVLLFAPSIRRFVFADTGYLQEAGHLRVPALSQAPQFEFLREETSRDVLPESEWKADSKYHGVAPFVRAEYYRHLVSGMEVVVERHRRRGPSALRDLPRLSVFFYRGDSQEGSRTLWLTVARRGANVLLDVLERLVDGGLIATDGSNCMRRCGGKENPYRFFADTAAEAASGTQLIQEWDREFSDPDGRRFRLLSWIATRSRRPTFLWQVTCT